MSTAKQGALIAPAAEDTAQQPVAVESSADRFVAVVERLAANPSVDVDKLERIIQLQERILAHHAKAAFDAAFVEMQAEIPEIDERGQVLVRGQLQSRYALNEDVQKVLKPILRKYGFTLSFRTEWPDKQTVRVVGILTHREGHSRESVFLSEADVSGNKNGIQALASAMSYGHRYTTKDLLNITSRGEDDDAARAGRRDLPNPPKGYDAWLLDMTATADTGRAALEAAWKQSLPQFRAYLTKYAPEAWLQIKARAEAVKA